MARRLEILQATKTFQNLQDAYAYVKKNRVLGIIEPVAIENIEKNIIERGFAEGWIKPQILYKELVKQ
jgi:glutamate synthase (NADPH/NADH) small chain